MRRKFISCFTLHMDRIQVLTKLYALQAIDLKVSVVEKSLREVRFKLSDNSAVESAEEFLQDLKAQLRDMNTKRRVVERAISDFQERLRKVEARLYGGSVTNPRELGAAEEERGFISGEQRLAEDTLLELMVTIEDTQSDGSVAKESLNKLKAERIEYTTELRGMEESLAVELEDLLSDKKQVMPFLSVQTLSLYDSLRKSRAGLAVAKVERGMCQGCRLTLSTMELQRVRISNDIVQCGSCNRILYVV